MTWVQKSESNIDRVWVELDAAGQETGLAIYDIAGAEARMYRDGIPVDTDGPPAPPQLHRVATTGVPWRPRWQRWSLGAAGVAGIVALAEIVHRLV